MDGVVDPDSATGRKQNEMRTRFFMVGLLAMLVAAQPAHSDEAGEPGRSVQFKGELDAGASYTNRCEFSTEIEPLTFQLNSFKNKYKVVRIRVANHRSEAIKLSYEKDAIELELTNGSAVPGTFNLRDRDAAVWDALSDDMRSRLAYPVSIRASQSRGPTAFRPEVVYLFALFPVDTATTTPRSFRYTMDSLKRTVILRDPSEGVSK